MIGFRWIGALCLSLASLGLASMARAHFVFVVPNEGGATVVLSEDLKVDKDIPADKFAGTKVFAQAADGKVTPLTTDKKESSLEVKVPGTPRLLYGTLEYGLFSRDEDAPPRLLFYHPKAILGANPGDVAIASPAKVEITPTGKTGEVRFLVKVDGKPLADAKVTVLVPDAEEKEVQTDAAGLTPAFVQTGRFGAWVSHTEKTPGKKDSKDYSAEVHIATLVVDIAK